MKAASERRQIAADIFLRALAACSMDRAFARRLHTRIQENGEKALVFGDYQVDLRHLRFLRVIAFGKAASSMLDALLPYLTEGSEVDLRGVLITQDRPRSLPEGIQFFRGGHPFPNEGSLAGARAALEMLSELRDRNPDAGEALCLFLVSGGGSAMMELPLDSSISLADTVHFHQELVYSGASITEMNCVRKHFSAVKGGRLVAAAGEVPSISLLVSDVPEGYLDALSSGPTLPDSSTVDQCREILQKYSLLERFPAAVRHFFISGLEETPKQIGPQARSVSLLSSMDLAETAKQYAIGQGYHVVIDGSCDDWDYRRAAEYLLERLRALRREYPRVCLISPGEVVVKISAQASNERGEQNSITPGVGGRNQQFVLYTATLLQKADAPITILSAGSDGIDGNSDAAGAVVDETLLLAEGRLASAHVALDTFNSGVFLKNAGAALVTGATGNNLRDLRILLADSL